jgi:O-antigen/teichoic acid export membrane protein
MLAVMVRDTIHQGSVYLIAQIVVAVTNVATGIILARIFATAEYGLLSIATLTISIVGTLIGSWLANATVRFQPFYKERRKLDIFYSTLVFCILPIVVCFSLLIPIYLIFNSYQSDTFEGLLPLIIALIPLNICFDILLANFRVKLQAKGFTTVQCLKTVMSLVVGLLLVLSLGFRVDGILLGQVAVILISVVIVFGKFFSSGAHVGSSGVSSSALKKFAAYGFPLTISSMSAQILTGADRYIINYYWGTSNVGIYSMSWSIASMVMSLMMTPLSLVTGPYITNVWESRNRGLAEKLLAQLTRLALLISLPMVVGISVLAVPLLKLLTTPSYYPGSIVIPLVAGAALFYGLAWLAYLGLGLAERTDIVARNFLIAAGVNVLLNFLLVPMFSFIGSALAYLISCAALLLLSAVSSRKYLKWVVPPKSLRNAIIASTVMGVSVYFSLQFFSNPLWQCIMGMGLGIGIYAILVLLLGEFTRVELSEMKKLVRSSHETINRPT